MKRIVLDPRTWLALTLPLLAVASCAGLNRLDPVDTRIQARNLAAEHRSPTSHLRVATYNVHGESADRLEQAIRGNPHLRTADVIFLQEVETAATGRESLPSRLAQTLTKSFVYAPGYGMSGGGSHGLAILSRFPLTDLHVIELPRKHVVFNSARRIAISATIEIGPVRVRMYNVHLDNRINPEDRRHQISVVLADTEQHPGAPTIIAGDMNTSPFCWLGHVVPIPCGTQDDSLEQYVRDRGLDTPVVGSGATSKWLAMRLDAIYTRHAVADDFGVDDAVRVSDHLPLWLDLSLTTDATPN